MDFDTQIAGSSIVFVVQGNQPGMFTENFLRKNGFFEEDTELNSAQSLPPISQYQFEKRFTFQAVDNKLLLNVNLKSLEKEDLNTEIDFFVDKAIKLFNIIDSFDFTAVGINYKFASTQLSLNKFSDITNKINGSINKINFSVPNDHCIVNVGLGNINDGLVGVEFNNHFDLAEVDPKDQNNSVHTAIDLFSELFSNSEKLLNKLIKY